MGREWRGSVAAAVGNLIGNWWGKLGVEWRSVILLLRCGFPASAWQGVTLRGPVPGRWGKLRGGWLKHKR
ncbi:hypothetical protein M8818_000223 [Zalaria obscura]|uniref:Uncharacterized protein n=1 Tax=Zalaria obscura TaxID=2024903 RepID=A0ACC3SPP6_9PEZI